MSSRDIKLLYAAQDIADVTAKEVQALGEEIFGECFVRASVVKGCMTVIVFDDIDDPFNFNEYTYNNDGSEA